MNPTPHCLTRVSKLTSFAASPPILNPCLQVPSRRNLETSEHWSISTLNETNLVVSRSVQLSLLSLGKQTSRRSLVVVLEAWVILTTTSCTNMSATYNHSREVRQIYVRVCFPCISHFVFSRSHPVGAWEPRSA